ncbi:MAG: glycosyltransferase [Nanoarchaeota archaeon]|nr:glycosyltransferase [Nanoarchaeota archaeon]
MPEKISIVIPTYNEEKYLPGLLRSISCQDYPCEIIVADSSADKTREIAEEAGCIVTDGGHIPKARNSGARIAKHDLLFLDADTILPDGFLKCFIGRAKEYGYATCFTKPTTRDLSHSICYSLRGWGSFIVNPFSPHVSGQCLFVKKELFSLSGGFDESLYLGEEHELANRLSRHGKGKFFTDMHVMNNPRRLEREGAFQTLGLDIYSELYRFSVGKVRHRLYERKYGHFS